MRRLLLVALTAALATVTGVVAAAARPAGGFFRQTTPLPPGAPLFADDFSTGQLAGWDFSTTVAAVVDDEGSSVLSLAGRRLEGGVAIIQGSEQWDAYRFDIRLKVSDSGAFADLADFGLLVRSDAEQSDFAAIFISPASDRVIVGSVVDNQIVGTTGANFPFDPGVYYNLRVTVEDRQVELRVDETPILSTRIVGQAARGRVGIMTFAGAQVYIDQVAITGLGDEGMAAPPATGEPAPGALTATVGLLPTNTSQPTGTPPFTAASEPAARLSIVAPAANLRGGPGASYPVLGTAQRGEIFPVDARADADGQTWYRIIVGDGELWVWADIVELTPANAPLPTLEIPPASTPPADAANP